MFTSAAAILQPESGHESSFHSFIREHYPFSAFILPAQKPENDLLDAEEQEKILELIAEKDYYELNRLIRKRYGWN